jgi:sugar phosphate isomerase/epimerase
VPIPCCLEIDISNWTDSVFFGKYLLATNRTQRNIKGYGLQTMGRNINRQAPMGIDTITMAVSSQYHSFPDRFEWIAENGFAMAYTPNGARLDQVRAHVLPYLSRGVPVRYHGYFPGYEIGNVDSHKAAEALELHMRSVDAMEGLGEQVMTVHIGLVPHIELSYDHVQKNLATLIDYAARKGVVISLENLRFGLTSDPEVVVELAEKCGSSITLDVGHAVTCDRVINGEMTVPQIVEMFAHLLKEVHYYEYETDSHYAPADMSILGPVIDGLLETDCTWWTIELNSYSDILNTRRLTEQYVSGQKFI